MARPRMELQQLLEALTEVKVYFQPPNGTQMVYPCITYKKDIESARHADNKPYSRDIRYMITVIDRNPDSAIPEKIASLPTSAHSRSFTAANLNHDVYTLYF